MAWLTNAEKWPLLVAKLRAAGEFGLDTETYDQPDRTSPQHRAKVHCWSVGWLTAARSPRGYRVGTGVVLPASALYDGAISDLLADPGVRKYAHNAPHDYHSLTNMGVVVANMVDTLQWARVVVPGLTDYGLKDMERWALGKPARPSFLQVVSYPKKVQRSTFKTMTRCVCGKVPCRARSDSEWWDQERGWFRLHERQDVRVETVHERTVVERYEVTDFVPGAELATGMWFPVSPPPRNKGVGEGTKEPLPGDVPVRMDVWDAYSLADAVSGIEIVDWLRTRPHRERRFPWQEIRAS